MKTLERKIFAAKLALFWEQFWLACFPALCVGGVFLLAALTGLLELLPQTAHTVVLVGFAIAFGIGLRPLFSLRWPASEVALRYLEKRSSLPHRPASSYVDTLDRSLNAPETLSIWQRHKQRLEQMLRKLRPVWPVSHVRNVTPMPCVPRCCYVWSWPFCGPASTVRPSRQRLGAGGQKHHAGLARCLDQTAGIYRHGADIPERSEQVHHRSRWQAAGSRKQRNRRAHVRRENAQRCIPAHHARRTDTAAAPRNLA